jgi:hypothetical protein
MYTLVVREHCRGHCVTVCGCGSGFGFGLRHCCVYGQMSECAYVGNGAGGVLACIRNSDV